MGIFRSWALYLLSLAIVAAGCVRNGKKDDSPSGLALTRVLILSGSNNHDWKTTTPLLKKMFEESGAFTARVVDHPDSLSPALLQQYDALVDNRNVWPEKNCTWSATAKDVLIHFVREGGALITLHAAGSKCYDWPEYREMAMARWGDSTRHGRIAPHKLSITNNDHPVTRGIRDFWTTDELWVETEITPGVEVLCTVPNPENKGRDHEEPVVFYRRYGKGICYYNLLGHDVRAMRNTGWELLTLRGTQWASGNAITIEPGYELSRNERSANADWQWTETDTSLALQAENRVLWKYNFKSRRGKPFFHPLCTGDGIVLTSLSPDDHPWHLGLWHSWKYINGLNYWEYKREQPWDYAGVTEVIAVETQKHADHSAEITLQLQYHPEDSLPLLDETRRVFVHTPANSDHYAIDYYMHFQARGKPVLLDRTPLENEPGGKTWGGYAGLSARLNQDFWQPEYINGNGSRTKGHGERYPWKYSGYRSLTGEDVGLAMMAHPDNPGHPPAWFVEDNPAHPFYYFSPAPLFHGPIGLAPGEVLDFRYRVIVLSGEPTSGQLQTYYEDFIRP